MDNKQRCQSCGMPLGENFYGTNMDGTETQEYCKYCYKNGEFIDPTLTLEKMIDSSVKYMKENQGFDEKKARELSSSVIPQLKRWNKI